MYQAALLSLLTIACAPAKEGEAGKSDGGVATSRLPVECRKNTPRTDPRCNFGVNESGTIGAGPGLNARKMIGGGIAVSFVDAGRVIAATYAAVDSNPNTQDVAGGIYAVDVVSGDRTLISGHAYDPKQGERTVGSGPDMGSVYDVQPGPGGWYALTRPDPAWQEATYKGALSQIWIFRIDPATGARAVIYNPFETKCVVQNGTFAIDRVDVHISLAVGEDGSFYVPMYRLVSVTEGKAGIGWGVGKISADGKTCSLVSWTGSGPPWDRGQGRQFSQVGLQLGLTLKTQDKLLSTDGMSIWQIDLASGDRHVISTTADPKVGSGDSPGRDDMVVAPDGTLWTSGRAHRGIFSLVTASVNPTTGDRVQYDTESAPAGIGHSLVFHPTLGGVVIQGSSSGAYSPMITVFEPATGNGYILSN